MKAKCIYNDVAHLSKKLQKFALTQDDKGIVDLTVGLEYKVYGIRKNKLGTFLLVLTDSIHSDLPWWMPQTFFEDLDFSTLPTSWQKIYWKGYGKEEVIAHPAYHDAMEDVEDGTNNGYEVFEEMKRDS